MDLDYIEDLMQETTQFEVTDDRKADWAIEKVLEATAERDRITAIADARIKELQAQKQAIAEKCANATSFLTSKLYGYFQTVTPTETKTQKTYKLLSGKLVLKHREPEFVVNQCDATSWAAVSAPAFVKVEKTFTWGAYKKYTTVQGENVVSTETGEVIPGIVAKAREDVFEVVK